MRVSSDDLVRERRVVRLFQRYVLNPPTMLAVRMGLVRGHVLVETIGRRTGKRRCTVVGMHVADSTGWVVAEQGHHAAYVRNLEANPSVRVCIKGKWRIAHAQLVPDDDPEMRLRGFGRPRHAANVRRFGTDLLTVRFDFDDQLEFSVVDPAQPAAQHCLRAYFAELDARFDDGFDPAKSLPAELDEMRPPAGLFLIAMQRGEPVGCGALKFHRNQPTELKRMWVASSARGRGVGRRLLRELELRAVEHGGPTIRLETNKTLSEAIALYRSAGYREVSAFNDERYADHWFEKQVE